MAYVPISQEVHGNKSWVRHSSMLFAKNELLAPLFISDLAAAVQALPIAFVKHEGSYALVVVMGLRPGENLLVSPQGEWLSEYMPSIYRSSPFELLPIQDDYALGIDESCIRNKGEGQPFFNENGVITESMRDVLNRTQNINETRQLTQHVCSVLAKYDLIKPWALTLNDGGSKQTIDGLYLIDEQALNNLPDETFVELRKANSLSLIYAQLFSMKKISYLAKLADHRPVISEEPQKNETFNFSGL